jgi:hypothetical protein
LLEEVLDDHWKDITYTKFVRTASMEVALCGDLINDPVKVGKMSVLFAVLERVICMSDHNSPILTTPTSTDETTQKACLCAHQRKTTYMKK